MKQQITTKTLKTKHFHTTTTTTTILFSFSSMLNKLEESNDLVR